MTVSDKLISKSVQDLCYETTHPQKCNYDGNLDKKLELLEIAMHDAQSVYIFGGGNELLNNPALMEILNIKIEE